MLDDPSLPPLASPWDPETEAQFLAAMSAPGGLDALGNPDIGTPNAQQLGPGVMPPPVAQPQETAPAADVAAQPVPPVPPVAAAMPPMGLPSIANAPAPAPAQHPDIPLGAIDVQPPDGIEQVPSTTGPIDAVSGVDAAPLPDDRAPAEMPNDYLSAEQLGVKLGVNATPEELAARVIAHDEARKNWLATNQLAESHKARQAAERAYAQYEADRQRLAAEDAQNRAEALKLANEKIDPDHWWSTRSTGQKITGFLAAIVGGMVQARVGGPNQGLAFIQNEIDRDIDAQKANLAHRRDILGQKQSAVAQAYARVGDAFRAGEVARAASYERAIGDLQTEAQKYDPRGTTALRIATTIQGLRGAQETALAKANAERQKQLQEAYKIQQHDRELAEAERAHKKSESLEGWRIATSNANEKDRIKLEQGRLDAEVAKLKAEGKDKEAEALQKFGVAGVTTTDGQPFVAQGTPEAVEKVRGSVAAAKDLVRIIDDARRLRTGYSSSVSDREEWQKLKTDWAHAKIAAKNLAQLGALSESDMDLLNDFLGAGDPTSFRSPIAGIEQARKNIIAAARQDVKSHAPDPSKVDFDIPDLQQNAPQKSDSQRELEKVLKTVTRDKGSTIAIVDPSQEKAITKWEQLAANGTDEQRKEATEFLFRVTKDAESPAVKDFAAAALQRLADRMPSPDEISTGPSTSTSHLPPIDKYGLDDNPDITESQ